MIANYLSDINNYIMQTFTLLNNLRNSELKSKKVKIYKHMKKALVNEFQI